MSPLGKNIHNKITTFIQLILYLKYICIYYLEVKVIKYSIEQDDNLNNNTTNTSIFCMY